ncbi:hypothetical protein [Kineosporia sp. NBRC 101731]|uniref:hypothetical protein n=1 Tax=Kineosporia sp. NBRC 101731 TaxID=3032199 RepID=UPI0024A1C701|nr:hypothetical protein [Kineosporia sp. NBRC 101731]GLY32577.1 hypothetical protein Kisp02_59420 [Kineosporia sp. NBRC 101731]
MALISIENDCLVVTLRGIRKLATFRGRLTYSLADVRGATLDPDMSTGWSGLRKTHEWPGRRVVGTNFYGRYLGGTFRQGGERVFWDVAKAEKAVVISLSGQYFRRLIVEVDDPEQAVRLIEGALNSRPQG